MEELIPVEIIEKKIHLIRGHKVMLDRDLAELYEVETRVLNQAVRRNIERFPEDFMFSLGREEIMRISQTVISSSHSEKAPLKFSKNVLVFTEQGVAMISGILNSGRASAFTRIRRKGNVRFLQVLLKILKLQKS
jgi:hypothetical protein